MHTTENAERSGFPTLDGTLDYALEGIQSLKVVLKLGIARLDLNTGAADRIGGDYWTAAALPLFVDYHTEAGESPTGVLTIKQRHEIGESFFGLNFLYPFRSGQLNLSLPPTLPIDLELRLGVGQAALDLSGLNVRSLRVHGGVGETRIILPAAADVDLDLESGVGELEVRRAPGDEGLRARSVRVDSGVGEVRIEMPAYGSYPVSIQSGIGEVSLAIPPTLAAQIAGRTGLGHLSIPRERFQPTGENRWQTTDYHAEAANRADVTVHTGIGEVNVVSAA